MKSLNLEFHVFSVSVCYLNEVTFQIIPLTNVTGAKNLSDDGNGKQMRGTLQHVSLYMGSYYSR